MGPAYEYVKRNPGLMLAEDYPNGNKQYRCKFNSTKRAVVVENIVFLPTANEELLKNALATVGPIAVGIEATDPFLSYGSGVFITDTCTGWINHAVVLVGNFYLFTFNNNHKIIGHHIRNLSRSS